MFVLCWGKFQSLIMYLCLYHNKSDAYLYLYIQKTLCVYCVYCMYTVYRNWIVDNMLVLYLISIIVDLRLVLYYTNYLLFYNSLAVLGGEGGERRIQIHRGYEAIHFSYKFGCQFPPPPSGNSLKPVPVIIVIVTFLNIYISCVVILCKNNQIKTL